MINQDAKKTDSINHRSLVIQKYICLRFFLFFLFFVLIIVIIIYITRPETDLTVHFGFISGKKYIYIEFKLIQFFELKKKIPYFGCDHVVSFLLLLLLLYHIHTRYFYPKKKIKNQKENLSETR